MAKTQKKKPIEIKEIPLADLEYNDGQIPDVPANPMERTEAAVKECIASLEENPEMLELRELLVYPWKRKYVVICGNTKRLALEKMGIASVICKVIPKEATREQLRAYALKDNHHFGTFNVKALAENWNMTELKKWGLAGLIKKKFKVKAPDTIAHVDSVETTIQEGDVFEIGRHRLMCGSSTNEEHVQKLFGEKSPAVDCILTDPPYCSGGFQEAQRSGGSIGRRAKDDGAGKNVRPKIANDRLSTRGWAALLKKALELVPANGVYCFTDWRMWVHLFDLLETCGMNVRQMLVWDKGSPGLGRGWRSQHEIVAFACRGVLDFKPEHSRGNVLNIGRTANLLHPTQKPTELLAAILVVSSWARSIYDPFGGSGTTMAAAEQENRTAYVMELSPQFCQVTIDRMVQMMPTVEVLRNGKPFPVVRPEPSQDAPQDAQEEKKKPARKGTGAKKAPEEAVNETAEEAVE